VGGVRSSPFRPLLEVALLALATAIVALVDAVMGTWIPLRAFYLVPSAIASWRHGSREGYALCYLGIATSFVIDWLDGTLRMRPAFAYSDALARLAVGIGVVVALARVRALQLKLDALAQTDELTRLANRRAFETLANREIARARRAGRPVSLAMLDLDGFKELNDARGHAEGDRVLVEVARAIASTRTSDVAARLGGDEFALFMAENDRERAEVVIDRARAAFRDAAAANGWPVSLSVGVVTDPEAKSELAELIARADAAMYEVKRSGKDAVRYLALPTPPTSPPTPIESASRTA